jgi:hypothetical protein
MDESMHRWTAIRDATAGFVLLLAMLDGAAGASAIKQGSGAGVVVSGQVKDHFRLENQAIGANWSIADGKVSRLIVTDRMHGSELSVGVPFAILLKDGTVYTPDNLRLSGKPLMRELAPRPDASRMADRLHGESFDLPLETIDHSLKVARSLILLDGSSYLRQTFTITAASADVPIIRVKLIDVALTGAHVSGSVKGSPIVVKEAAEKYGADPGVWMSPRGGYSKPKKERIEFGRTAGYEIIANGYALSGPKYYAAFRDVCLDMIRKYGVNQFKFDGTGNVDSVFPGSHFDSDFAAAINLIGELRTAKPDIYINLTTGTWPSPFWLMYADSIWRGGEDDGTAGVGTFRERWITYRDADTYKGIVQNGPLYLLNSLMLHGMIYAKHRKQLEQTPEMTSIMRFDLTSVRGRSFKRCI